MKRTMKGLAILFSFLLVCFVVLFNYWEKKGNDAPLQLKTVLSGSMADTYSQGSLLLIRKVSSQEIQLNDVITFNAANEVVSHRVVQIAEENPRKFVTKGDNNPSQDQQLIGEKELIGKVVLGIPKLGKFLLVVQTEAGKVAILLTIGQMLLLEYWIVLLFSKEDGETRGSLNHNIKVR